MFVLAWMIGHTPPALAKESARQPPSRAVASLLRTLRAHDVFMAEHSVRVGTYSKWISEGLGLSQRRKRAVVYAALLHDVGKTRMPAGLLMNTRPQPDSVEWALIERHPRDGARLVREQLGQGALARKVHRGVLLHHERLDGSGYPHKRLAAGVPLEARIVAVADSYDAMTSKRSYNTPMTQGQAIARLRELSGHELDASVVEVFARELDRRLR